MTRVGRQYPGSALDKVLELMRRNGMIDGAFEMRSMLHRTALR